MIKPRILKRHAGRPIDFKGNDGQVFNGHIKDVARGYATILFSDYLRNDGLEYTAVLKVNSKRIVEVY